MSDIPEYHCHCWDPCPCDDKFKSLRTEKEDLRRQLTNAKIVADRLAKGLSFTFVEEQHDDAVKKLAESEASRDMMRKVIKGIRDNAEIRMAIGTVHRLDKVLALVDSPSTCLAKVLEPMVLKRTEPLLQELKSLIFALHIGRPSPRSIGMEIIDNEEKARKEAAG